MQEVEGDFWEYVDSNRSKVDAIVCTTNTTIDKHGLVMGGGIARDFAQRFPFLPALWGMRIRKNLHHQGLMCNIGAYPRTSHASINLVAMPTKHDWKLPSTEEIVKAGVTNLNLLTNIMGWKRVVLPRPGCGLGGLHWYRVKKHICEVYLDDRFVVVNKE